MNDTYDDNLLKWVKYFNKFDLYSKEDDTEITDEIKEYYNSFLLDKFFPYKLKW